jgi:enamine deaminase RidA (YjgF/YER057c/UK114 family)
MASSTRSFRTNNPYEREFRYCRAIRKGPFIVVSGTTSVCPVTGVLLHPESAFDQATQIFNEISRAVEALGGQREDIVRVRMFVRDSSDQGDVARALKESAFGLTDTGPAASMILGAGFVDDDMKVEIEADALVL